MKVSKCEQRRWLLPTMLVALAISTAGVSARNLTYQDAMDIALRRSSRAEILKGNLDVAERNYFAKRVNFYLPEISLNGTAPAYTSAETYDYPDGGGGQKIVALRKTLDLQTFIGLKQSLITGGELTINTRLTGTNQDYPQRGVTVSQEDRLGSFEFTLTQPILQPSDGKNELNNRKDDLELAKLTQHEEIASLKTEVAQTYVGALEQRIQREIAAQKLESANLQASIDSSKFEDGVISEEDWLISSSARLDAELNQYDVQNELSKKLQDLVILLELESTDSLELEAPPAMALYTPAERQQLIASSDRSIPIQKAEYDYRKAKRAADYASSAAGIKGTLTAEYSKRAGKTDISASDPALAGVTNLNLDRWGVRLDLSYPLWDGGASGASVKAQEIEAQKAKIELERQRRAARAEIKNLVSSIDVSERKLDVLRKQIDLAKNRLDIARERFDDGQISRITYLEASVAWLEARQAYLAELQNYLVDTYNLESKFTG